MLKGFSVPLNTSLILSNRQLKNLNFHKKIKKMSETNETNQPDQQASNRTLTLKKTFNAPNWYGKPGLNLNILLNGGGQKE